MKDNFSQAIVENSKNIPTPTLTLGLTRGGWGAASIPPSTPKFFENFQKRGFLKRGFTL